jgi:hypothetical protein
MNLGMTIFLHASFQSKYRVLMPKLTHIVLLLLRMSSAFCYKLLKPHLPSIIEHTIFPLLCFSDADDNLWKNDPKEFIKQKYGENLNPIIRLGILVKAILFP